MRQSLTSWQYGNEPSVNILYTQVALLVDVAPAGERSQVLAMKEGNPSQGPQDADAASAKNEEAGAASGSQGQ
jgi:hypothetical protein